MVRFASLSSLAILAAAPLAAAAATPAGHEPGVYWEQKMEMQMQGFSMPAQTSKVCLPKASWEDPPGSRKDDKCEVTDVKRTASRMQWKMRCKDGSTGEGDITYGPDQYSGAMTMRTQGQEMQMKMQGRKLGGDCDAGEMKRKVAEMKQQAETAQAQQAQAQEDMCRKAAEEMNLTLFVPFVAGVPPTCKDPAAFCAKLETREGLVAFRKASKDEKTRAKAEKLCKKDLAAIEKKHCAAAEKELGKTRKLEGDTVEFAFGFCPDLANALAKKECAGRKFTAMPDAQREFCTKYASRRLRQTPAEDEAEEPAAKEKAPADVKSKIMKGIFGR